MSTDTTQPTPQNPTSPASFEASHVVFDLAAVRFRRAGAQMLVLSPTGEQLGAAQVSVNGDKEACLAALDDAAARTRVWRYGSQVQVGFYNPFTAEISLGPSFAPEVFSLNAPVGFSDGGLLVRRSAEDVLETQLGVSAKLRPTPSLSELSRLLITSRDSDGRISRS